MPLTENLANRNWLTSRLRAEIVGPDPAGEPREIVPGGDAGKFSWEEFRKPKKQKNGEEIVWQDPPAKRYGAGILYPVGVVEEAEQARSGDDVNAGPDAAQPPESREADDKLERLAEKNASKSSGLPDDSEDYNVTLANAFRPSAIGISFLADLDCEKNGMRVELVSIGRLGNEDLQEIPVGTYRQTSAMVGDPGGVQYPRSVWLRVPLLDDQKRYPHIEVSSADLLEAREPIRKTIDSIWPGLEMILVSRRYPRFAANQRLITVSLINRRALDAGKLDEQCLFQSGIRVRGLSESAWIQPYPEAELSQLEAPDPLSDERVNRLLYRQYQTYAIGHGCAADWPGNMPSTVSQVWTDVMPAFEAPATNADLMITGPDGAKHPVAISMRKLAGLDRSDDGWEEVGALLTAYENWIESLRLPRPGIPGVMADMLQTAEGLIARCEDCLGRIRDGIAFLREDSETSRFAREAFRLANHAMLIAQLRTTREVRIPSPALEGGITWTPAITNPDPSVATTKGYWRAFQIGFILMSLRAIAQPESDHRDIVDLIWFPTGGGKTEAYLGLTAFTILFNRISGRQTGGADVLMRYTLRLLTAQQFQRASLLFCSMEHLRRNTAGLGDKPFRIGLWVGGSASPNSRKEAVQALESLQSDPESENPFVLLKCPWCGAKFGPSGEVSDSRRRGRRGGGMQGREAGIPSVLGYRRYTPTNQHPPTVVFSCNDPACEFGTGSTFQRAKPPLPIVIIDEDLFDDPPNLIIGTVDKFAMLAWKPQARRMFGIGDNGKHAGLPPSLIIQDELHLISGPLGSMVGAYETVIESLCRRDGVGHIKPKIIASTATISRAHEQIKHLYARNDVFLFPPSGLEAGDSFFACEARNEDGSLKPGRLYLGVLAPSHGSLQTTEARVFACLMQHAATMLTDDDGRDPWWTLLCFFNSLRELGSAASLFVADTRDYLRVILDRHGIHYATIRKLFEVSELTSRIRSDQVPKELERLEKPFVTPSPRGEKSFEGIDAVDACLASNIIEVGVDVSRLALMAIVGQPKTTSQYIQVSSRVGRDPEKPGLVVVLYGQSKPRDRSHYERFRPYHQRLYAQVEPTSVTPFSPPAVERALHGILVAAVRQLGLLATVSSAARPFPLDAGTPLRDMIEMMIEERVSLVAPVERDSVMIRLQRRLDEWRVWQPSEYGGFGAAPQDPPLLHPAGSSEPPQWNGRSWPTMSSLRDVDASCEADVTGFFNQLQEEQS
ncbi:MAG: helicase [Sterolibacteriaceae bacterium]|uniref:Helicase n=1 Tax=Candidatus Methylophosphatis roskildensis TaxID=2899263 RepID=A0A9D7HLA0_9PROT|nr:helicase [Candidatus Methylophosphatis roskildensis]